MTDLCAKRDLLFLLGYAIQKFLTMNFKKYYQKELKAILGRETNKEDGIQESSLSEILTKKNIVLPDSLKTYYEIGARLVINKEHNVLYDPTELELIDGFLVFAEENQRVVIWGIRESDLLSNDPIVYQGQEHEKIDWYSEEKTFSEFIIDMWRWQRNLPPYNM